MSDVSVTFSFPPKRIVSLCPGITDTLFALDLEEKIVGRTRFCIHPKDKVEKTPAVAGTKDIKLKAIQDVRPDLIIVEKEENTKEIVEELEKHFPVYVAEVQSVDDAFRMIEDMGKLTDRMEAATNLLHTIKQQFDALPKIPENVSDMSFGESHIWSSEKIRISIPYWIKWDSSILSSNMDGRYPVVTADDFQKAELDYVLLASEPFPFKEKHAKEFMRHNARNRTHTCRRGNVLVWTEDDRGSSLFSTASKFLN